MNSVPRFRLMPRTHHCRKCIVDWFILYFSLGLCMVMWCSFNYSFFKQSHS